MLLKCIKKLIITDCFLISLFGHCCPGEQGTITGRLQRPRYVADNFMSSQTQIQNELLFMYKTLMCFAVSPPRTA